MHIYDRDGKPKYEIPYAGKREGMRKTTLSDAKKNGWLPSVTSVFDVLNKPGLNIWLQDRVLESALTMTRNDGESDEDFIARIKHDSKELSLLAMNEGTRIHDEIESEFKGRLVNRKYSDITSKVKASVYEYFGTEEGWKSEEYFSHQMGYGGKCDLNNRLISVVLDFKTKEEFKLDKKGNIIKMAYDEQAMQLSAYAKGLKIRNARLVNVFVDYSGNTVFHEWSKEEKEHAWKMFKCCLELWKLQKRYDSKF